MAKDVIGKYYPGKRSNNWIKVKVRNTADAYIIGYTKGSGNREDTFGALHLASVLDGKMVYRGKVGTGFTDKNLKEIWALLKHISTIPKQIQESIIEEKKSKWIEAQLCCSIEYASITPNNTYREPVFVQLKGNITN